MSASPSLGADAEQRDAERRRRALQSFMTPPQLEGVELEKSTVADHARAIIEHLTSGTPTSIELQRCAALLAEATSALAVEPVQPRRYFEPAPTDTSEPGRSTFALYSPTVGQLNPIAAPMVMSIEPREIDGITRDVVVGNVTMGRAYEGPPGHVHGGFIAALFDEVLGFAQTFGAVPGMTGRLTIRYRTPTPLGRPLQLVGWVTDVSGRKTDTHATLHTVDADGRPARLCAEADGLFIAMDEAAMAQLAKSRNSTS